MLQSTPSSGGSSIFHLMPDTIGRLNLANLPSIGFGGLGNLGGNLGVSKLVNPFAGLPSLKPIGNFTPLPSLNWEGKFDKFIASANALPKSLAVLSNALPSIKKELNKAGIINGYDLYLMKDSPINTPTLTELTKNNTPRPETLMFVSVDGKEKETKLSIDKKGNTYQIISVEPNTYIYVSVKNTNKNVKAEFNNKEVVIMRDKNNIIKVVVPSPAEIGTYALKFGDLLLEVRVKTIVAVEEPQPVVPTGAYTPPADGGVTTDGVSKKLSPIQKLWNWFTK